MKSTQIDLFRVYPIKVPLFILVTASLLLNACTIGGLIAQQPVNPAQPSATAMPAPIISPTAGSSPTPPAGSLAGLVYNDLSLGQVLRIQADNQPARLVDAVSARIAPDGSQAIYEADGDLWIANLADRTTRNLTNTPDMIEGNAQWWPANPGKIVYLAKYPGSTATTDVGLLSTINVDGSENSVDLGGGPLLSMPSLSSDGKTIAYDWMGLPELYEMGVGSHPFDARAFGFEPASEPVFASPAWSPDGQVLLWWVVENPSGDQKVYNLLSFNLNTKSYSTIYVAKPIGGTQALFPSPLWSPDSQWLAVQIYGVNTPKDLVIIHPDGSQEHLNGLAANPVWSPDGARIAFVQEAPRSSNMPAKVQIMDVRSWTVVDAALPQGSIPNTWLMP